MAQFDRRDALGFPDRAVTFGPGSVRISCWAASPGRLIKARSA
jgi:hypothetical protein